MNKILQHYLNDRPTAFRNDDHCEYWCDICDANAVDSRDHSTGRFFIAFGHVVNNVEEHTGVQFAICNDCLEAK